ncbi:GNAT family N-acetyltransferase, partial [Stenotrophomonas sp. NPDC077659]
PWVMDELRLFRLQAEVLDFNEGTARCAVYKRGALHDLRRFARVRTQLP